MKNYFAVVDLFADDHLFTQFIMWVINEWFGVFMIPQTFWNVTYFFWG